MKRPDQIKTPPKGIRRRRMPPGQFLTKKFPVLTYGTAPEVDIEAWRLKVFGLVRPELELDWLKFSSLTWTAVEADFHCVTQWTCQDQTWEGVAFSEVLSLTEPAPEAEFVMVHSYGGYSTNLPLELVMKDGLFAHKQNGRPLGEGHGWPLRLVMPSLYGWKSAKWVSGVELMANDAPGFWEQRGYHNDGDPWEEQRFWPELARPA